MKLRTFWAVGGEGGSTSLDPPMHIYPIFEFLVIVIKTLRWSVQVYASNSTKFFPWTTIIQTYVCDFKFSDEFLIFQNNYVTRKLNIFNYKYKVSVVVLAFNTACD